MTIGLLVISIKSIGCPSCIAPAKTRFLQVRGVKGVHVKPGKLIILYDPKTTTPEEIIESSSVKDYYIITSMENKLVEEEDIRRYIYTTYALKRG